MQSMACMGYVLSMPPCKMAMKSSDGRTCCCQYRSCCGLAERNVRLYHTGAISKERLRELSLDLGRTCPLASCYEQWLLAHRQELPIGRPRGLKRTREERRRAVQEWLRQFCSDSANSGTSTT